VIIIFLGGVFDGFSFCDSLDDYVIHAFGHFKIVRRALIEMLMGELIFFASELGGRRIFGVGRFRGTENGKERIATGHRRHVIRVDLEYAFKAPDLFIEAVGEMRLHRPCLDRIWIHRKQAVEDIVRGNVVAGDSGSFGFGEPFLDDVCPRGL
jgi:hypothetical protein